MKIEIIDSEGCEITSFELECNPFKIGESIYIDITNKDESFWDIEEVRQEFEILKIMHFSRQIYSARGQYNFAFTTSVEVKPI